MKNRVRTDFDVTRITGWVLVAICVVLIGFPLLFVIAQGFAPGIGLQQEWNFNPGLVLEIFDRPLWRLSLYNSLVLATGAMVMGTILGTGLAFLTQTRKFRFSGLIDASAWILLVSPSFIIAQGWVLFSSPSGVARNSFGIDISSLVFSPIGLITIMSLTNFPYAYLAVSAALKWDHRSLWDAGSLAGVKPATIFWTLRLPILLPSIMSGAILIFVDTIGDFGLPSAVSAQYNYPTLPYSIYAAVRQSPVRFDLGGVLALYLVVIVAIAISLYFRLITGSTYSFLAGGSMRTRKVRTGYSWVCSLIAVLVLLITLCIPIGTSAQVSVSERLSGGFSPENFTLDHYKAAFAPESSLLDGIFNSIWIAAAVAVFTTLTGLFMAIFMTFVDFRGNKLFDLISTLSLAVPGIVVAVGYIFVWNQPLLTDIGLNLYGKPVLLVMVGVASALPLAVRLQAGSLVQVSPNLLTAAETAGAGFFRRVSTILVPLVAPAVVSAFAAVLASSVFDLAATMMLAPPSFATLPVEILSEYEKGRYGYATAGAVASMVLVIALVSISRLVGARLLAFDGTLKSEEINYSE